MVCSSPLRVRSEFCMTRMVMAADFVKSTRRIQFINEVLCWTALY